MSDSLDTNNLLYVTKQYETEVKEKAKQLHENNDVATTINNIDKQLNDILLEMSDKIDFVTDKINSETGVDAYLRGVHTQIDNVRISHDDLVSDAIKDTESHPSSVAFKNNRSETKFNSYDFINKKLSFNHTTKDDICLDFDTSVDETKKSHTFIFNVDSREYIKIIEFAVTYKQHPDILDISEDIGDNLEVVKTINKRTPTIAVNRVLTGKFFLIRHDPVNAPKDFIVKAIVENSDNTGNIIDKKIIDVKSIQDSDGKDISYIFDNGPQFDLYFNFIGNNDSGLAITLGKIVPYRFAISTDDIKEIEKENNFVVSDSMQGFRNNDATSMNIEDVFYSKNLNTVFVVDKTNRRIAITNGGNNRLSEKSFSNSNDFNYTKGDNIHEFWVKDVGAFTFIRIHDDHQDTTYVGTVNVKALLNTNSKIKNVKLLSTGECVVLTQNWYYFDQNTYRVTGNTFADISSVSTTGIVTPKSDIIEDDDKAIIFVAVEDGVYYKVKEKSSVDNTYASNNTISYHYILTTTGYEDVISELNPTTTDLIVTKTVDGVVIAYNLTNSNAGTSFNLTYHIRNLVKTGISYDYTVQNILKFKRYNSANMQEFNKKFIKLINTSLYTFGITEENRLYIIDEYSINEAVSFQKNEYGTTDENSYLQLDKSDAVDFGYLSDHGVYGNLTPYLCQILDVSETPNGIFIFDTNAVFQLENDKTLKCVLTNNSVDTFTGVKYLISYNKTGSKGAFIAFNGKTVSSRSYSVYINDYSIKDTGTNSIRHKYIDLYGKSYQLFDGLETEYNDDYPIIDLKIDMYVTFIDHLSVIYNTESNNYIIYSYGRNWDTYDKSESKKYTVCTNKYGFLKYTNLLSVNDIDTSFSNINEFKKYRIIHKPGDKLTLNEVLEAIDKRVIALTKKLVEEDGNIDITAKFDYKYDKNKTNNENIANHLGGVYQDMGRWNHNDDLCKCELITTRHGTYGIKYDSEREGYNFIRFSLDSSNEYSPVTFTYRITDEFEKATDFNVVDLDDTLQTVFLSNGVYTYKTTGYSSAGSRYYTPFCYNDPVITKMVGLYDEPIRLVRKFGNSVYLSSDYVVYKYLNGTLVEAQKLDNSGNVKILDFVKIGDDVHLFYSKNDGFYFYYIIFGSRTVDFGYQHFEWASSDIDTLHIYNFSKHIFGYYKRDGKHQGIIKYNNETKVFEDSIHDTSNPNSWYKWSFAEVNDVIYMNNLSPCGNVKILSIYDIDNNYIKSIDNAALSLYSITDEIDSNVLSDKFEYKNTIFYNKSNDALYTPTKLIFTLNNKHLQPATIENGIKYNDCTETRLCTSYFPTTQEIIVNGEKYNKLVLKGIMRNGSNKHIVDMNNIKFNESNKIHFIDNDGYVNITYNYYKLVDNSTEPDENETYYLFEYKRTVFSPVLRSPYLRSSIFDNVYKYEEIENGDYYEVDTSIVTNPIPGIRYFTMSINGEYVPTDDKFFDPLKTYYAKEAKFTKLDPKDYIASTDELTTITEYGENDKYFTTLNPFYRVAVASDFTRDGDVKHFKSNIQYFTLNNLNYKTSDYDIYDNKYNLDYSYYKLNEYEKLEKVLISELPSKIIFNTSISDLHNATELGFSNSSSSLIFDISDTDIYNNSIDLQTHRTIYPLYRLYKIKDQYFGLFLITTYIGGTINVAQKDYNGYPYKFPWCFARCSADAKVIYEIIMEGSDTFRKDDFVKDLDIYEFEDYVFFKTDETVYVYDITNNVKHIAYEGHYYKFINKCEDGTIYLCTSAQSPNHIIQFYKFDTDSLTFEDTPSVEYPDLMVGRKWVSRKNKNGNIETYLFGGLKHDIYKFCENELQPAFVGTYLEHPNKNLLYAFPYKNKLYLLFDVEDSALIYDFDTNTIEPMGNQPILKKYISTENIPNYIGNSLPSYDKDIFIINETGYNQSYAFKPVYLEENSNKCQYYNTFISTEGENETEIKQYFLSARSNPYAGDTSDVVSYVKDTETYPIGYGQKRYDEAEMKPILNNVDKIPVIDKYGNIYFNMCMGDIETFEPKFDLSYSVTHLDGSVENNFVFDIMWNTSKGVFAILEDAVYINTDYGNPKAFVEIANGCVFRHLESSTSLRGVRVQECGDHIFILFGTHIYEYDSNENKLIESFEGNDKYYQDIISDNSFFIKCYNGPIINDPDKSAGYRLVANKTNDYIAFICVTSSGSVGSGMASKSTKSISVFEYDFETKKFNLKLNKDLISTNDGMACLNVCDTSIGMLLCGSQFYQSNNIINLSSPSKITYNIPGSGYSYIFDDPESGKLLVIGNIMAYYSNGEFIPVTDENSTYPGNVFQIDIAYVDFGASYLEDGKWVSPSDIRYCIINKPTTPNSYATEFIDLMLRSSVTYKSHGEYDLISALHDYTNTISQAAVYNQNDGYDVGSLISLNENRIKYTVWKNELFIIGVKTNITENLIQVVIFDNNDAPLESDWNTDDKLGIENQCRLITSNQHNLSISMKFIDEENNYMFVLYNGCLFISSYNLKLTKTYTKSHEKRIGFNYKFIGSNTKNLYKYSKDDNVGYDDKYVFVCSGQSVVTSYGHDEYKYDKRYYDMNNYIHDNKVYDSVDKIYFDRYVTSEHSARFELNDNILSSMVPSTEIPLKNLDQFDDEYFIIDLMIYPSDFNGFTTYTYKRPLNSSKPVYQKRRLAQPFYPYD